MLFQEKKKTANESQEKPTFKMMKRFGMVWCDVVFVVFGVYVIWFGVVCICACAFVCVCVCLCVCMCV